MIGFGVKKYGHPGLLSEERCNCVDKEIKTCDNCIHGDKSATDIDSPCYLCLRNLLDHRVDKWESKNDI